MKIEITIDQLLKFLKIFGGEYGINYRALIKLVPILRQSLLNNVFRKPHSDTKMIVSKRELAMLIKTGTGYGHHKPAPARDGAQYSQEYLKKKASYGEFYPHKFLDYGFWNNIDISPVGPDLKMRVQPIIKRGFDYITHHERNRSVLKRAFLDCWGELIKEIIKHYAEEIKAL